MRLYVPPDFKKDKILVIYQFVSNKHGRLGEPLIGMVNIPANANKQVVAAGNNDLNESVFINEVMGQFDS